MYTISNLANATKIRLIDESNYKPETCRNGGNYAFWTKFQRVSADKWEVSEGTTADFCPYCRSWDCSGECHESEYCDTSEVIREMNNFDENPDKGCYIEITESEEQNMNYPESILKIVRQNLDLEPTDTSRDEDIQNMSRAEVLERVCSWEGLIGYAETIKEWIKDIYGINLDEIG